jgi:hypothetical protein
MTDITKKILSFDVGMKNLAYCIINKENKEILNWGLIDITNEIIIKCDGFKKNKEKCSNLAKIYQVLNKKNVCKQHLDNFNIQNQEDVKNVKIKCEFVNKNNKQCDKYVKNYYKVNNKLMGFCNVHKNKSTKELKKINCNDIAIDIKKYNMILKLDNLKEMLDVDEVIIENQPAYKNPPMKAISSTLYAYFLIRGQIDGNIKKIKFVSPSSKTKKIKDIDKSKQYKLTKEQGIKDCLELIKNDNINLDFFNSHKKKDDLADCFLLAIKYISS